MDEDVRIPDGGTVFLVGIHVVETGDHVADVVDLRVGDAFTGAEFDADHHVGTHLTGDIHRIVVQGTAVHQYPAVLAQRREIARDGHRGAKGIHEGATAPDDLLMLDQIHRHTGERNRHLVEVQRIQIADGQRGEEVVDVLPVNQRHGDVVEQRPGRSLFHRYRTDQ